jgi:hypothetical protein
MPGVHVPETCPICAGFLSKPPLDRCTEPERHDAQPKPGKGFNPPYMQPVAEAVADSPTEDDVEDEEKPPWQP